MYSLKTDFGYVPSTKPAQASFLRQIAYQEGYSVPGLDADPAGWRTSRPIPVRGAVFGKRDVEAKCTVRVP